MLQNQKCYKVNSPRRKMDKFELASDTSAEWKKVLLLKEMLKAEIEKCSHIRWKAQMIPAHAKSIQLS